MSQSTGPGAAFNPSAFIFDMDGTLIDNMPFHNRTWIEYLSELGASPDPRTFHELTAGKTNPEILRQFLGQALSDADVDAYSREKEIRYRSRYRGAIAPLPGALEFLARARQGGMPLALATSAGRENIAFVLEILGIEGIFQAIVSAEDVTRGKPDPQAFLLAARRLGVEPGACLVFEDSPKGVEAAARAGMAAVVLLTAMPAAQALALPNVTGAYRNYTGLDPFSLP